MKKYEKVTKEMYEQWREKNQAYRDKVKMDKDRLVCHLMPETGWLNDPNGLCQFNGVYHIYYQYTPFEPTGEIKLWGHYTTRDFVHYVSEEPVLFPDQDFDVHGVYSGSAFVENGIIHYFYTGNVKYFDRDDYDYIMSGRGSNTVHFTSGDGFHFSDKELLMTNKDYPSDISNHVRDPKIFEYGGSYYMALGARDDNSAGLVLIYKSRDLIKWEYDSRIRTNEPFGFMWECPDLFWLDGELCLICCPQGVKKQGVDYWNVHQCVIMRLKYDSEANVYEVMDEGHIPMVDRGFDFYAPQSFVDEKGRRIIIGWMGIPDADYTNPTVEAGWQHALTIPRELHMVNGRLVQSPLEEFSAMRRNKMVYSGDALGKGLEAGLVFEGLLKFDRCGAITLTLRSNVTLDYGDGLLTLDMGDGGSGRTRRSVEISYLKELHIFSDTTSLEIFVNEGEQVFTTRVYDDGTGMKAAGDYKGTLTLYDLAGFVYDNRS